MRRALCIALHDVAPATWPACERMLALLQRVGNPPVTLLAVPDYHHCGSIEHDTKFVRAIERRHARGDEIALHGMVHLDESAAPRTLLPWMRRRLLTASEGEFADLDESEAWRRISTGIELLTRLGWNPRGFVAPAWLMGAGARAALLRSSLRYTTTHTHLHDLNNDLRIAAPCLTASARSHWRRRASRAWLNFATFATRHAPIVRIGLHPADAGHADLYATWERILRTLLSTREPLTKSAAIAMVPHASTALPSAAGAEHPDQRDAFCGPRDAH